MIHWKAKTSRGEIGWQPQVLRTWGWLNVDGAPAPFLRLAIPKAFRP